MTPQRIQVHLINIACDILEKRVFRHLESKYLATFKRNTAILQALLTALATASSSATLPVTVNCVEANKVDRRIAR